MKNGLPPAWAATRSASSRSSPPASIARRSGVLGRQRLHPQRHRVGQPARPVRPVLQELPARHAHDEQRHPAGLLHELLDQVEQQRVGLVEVLEHQDDRAPAREPGEHREDALAYLGGLVAVLLAAVLVAAQREAEPPDRAAPPRRRRPTRRPRRGAGSRPPRRARRDPRRARDGPSGRAARTSTSSSNGLERPVRTFVPSGSAARNSSDDPGLPDAGLPEQRDEVRAFSRRRPLERVGRAARARAAGSRTRSAAGRRRARARPSTGHAITGPSNPFASIARGSPNATDSRGELHGRSPARTSPGRGRLLQPRADVHLGADHDVAVVGRADRDLAGVHPDPHAASGSAGPSSRRELARRAIADRRARPGSRARRRRRAPPGSRTRRARRRR